jgi:GT2 family glycosyltransferase
MLQDQPFGISVVVVNWNSKRNLADCLESLSSQTDGAFDVVVVDNGSSDGSVELVRAEHPKVTLVAARENLGFAEGCNRGIEVATQPWIATLNNDAVADPHWIAQLRAAARTGAAHLGMIQSRIVFRQRPDRTNSTGVLMFPDGGAIDRDCDAPLRVDDLPDEVFCASAGAALYRRSMLEETRLHTGYFDRSFFMYFEDVDLGWRCRLAGWTACYVPSAVVHHSFHGSAGRHGEHFVLHQCQKNRVRCVLKNASWWFLLRAAPNNLGDAWRAIKRGGAPMAAQFARATLDGWQQRQDVQSMLRVAPELVEHRWMQPGR